MAIGRPVSGEEWILWGCGLSAVSGLPGLLQPRRSQGSARLAALLVAAGSILGLIGTAQFVLRPESRPISWPSPIDGARFEMALDPLSMIFLLPAFIVAALGAIYGLGYWDVEHHPGTGRKLRLFYGILAGSLPLIVVATSGMLFLFAWEGMALSAFFLVATEDDNDHVRAAGWL